MRSQYSVALIDDMSICPHNKILPDSEFDFKPVMCRAIPITKNIDNVYANLCKVENITEDGPLLLNMYEIETENF